MTMQPHQAIIEDPGELADNMELQVEQIRRERMSKRAKAQQEVERVLTRSTTVLSRVEDQPLVGNLIGEDHVNYVLMYNMLTGIRIAVSTRVFVARAYSSLAGLAMSSEDTEATLGRRLYSATQVLV